MMRTLEITLSEEQYHHIQDDGHFCKFRKAYKDGSFSEWKASEFMIIEMRD